MTEREVTTVIELLAAVLLSAQATDARCGALVCPDADTGVHRKPAALVVKRAVKIEQRRQSGF